MRISLLAAALMVVTACAHKPAPIPPPVPMEAKEAEEKLRQVSQEAEALRRYQGLVRVRGKGSEGTFDARLVVVFARPARLRVELLGAFGATRWAAVATDAGITAYFPGRRQYLQEPDVADVVGRLLGLRMTVEEVMAVLTGSGLPLGSAAEVTGYYRGAAAFLELGATDGGGRIELDADGQVVRAQGAHYRVTYPTPWKKAHRPFPEQMVVENDELRASLVTEDVDANIELDSGAFELGVPADAVRLRPAEVGGEAVFVITKEPPRKREELLEGVR